MAFATARGVGTGACTMQAFFVVPAARRGGLGRWFAPRRGAAPSRRVEVPFQHETRRRGVWRRVAADLWGGAWVETEEPVPGKPGIPPDHWIRSTLTR